MNALLRFDPFRDLEDFQNRVSSLFHAQSHGQPQTQSQWSPAVDIEEDDKDYLFKFELSELEKEDIKVKVDDGVLAVSGERKAAPAKDAQKKYLRVERSFGAFHRSFVLPEDSDATQITAEFKNGVLTVRLPKQEKAQPKLIDVKVN